MKLQQLSVFLENRKGRLTEVMGALAQARINISAQCIAETSDFGVLRMVVSDPARACQVLRQGGYSVTLTDVLCVKLDNVPGQAHAVLLALSGADIGVEYLYAFAWGEHAFLVLRTTDIAASLQLLLGRGIQLISAQELTRL